MSNTTTSETNETEIANATREHKLHSYISNRIPWYMRLLWLLFWVFAVYYTIVYLFPSLQTEIVNPP